MRRRACGKHRRRCFQNAITAWGISVARARLAKGGPHTARGSCLGHCGVCHGLIEGLPRGPQAAAAGHLDGRRAGPEALFEFVDAPEVCQVDSLFPLSLDREFWSLAALRGGPEQLNFPGAVQAVRLGVAACTKLQAVSVDAFGQALRLTGLCASGGNAEPSEGCSRHAAQAAILAIRDRWRDSAGVSAHTPLVPLGDGFTIPRGNETMGVLIEYARRVWQSFRDALESSETAVSDEGLTDGAVEDRELSNSTFPTKRLEEGIAAYHRMTALSLELARHCRQMMENLRLAWGVRSLQGELQAIYPDILQTLPPVVFHTAIYGRHWDVLEWLLLGLHQEKEAAAVSSPLHMAEMGVACGAIGFYLLLRFPDLQYVGADPTIQTQVHEAYGRFGDRAQLHVKTSEELERELPADAEFDFVFIDGPHTYANVANDISMWFPRVRQGGIIAGHDFTCAHPPLLWAVLESRMRISDGPVNVGFDGVWWWRKE